MSYVAVRQRVEESGHGEFAAALSQTDGSRLVEAVWAPGSGEVLAVYEGDEAAANVSLTPFSVQRVLPITAEEYGPPEAESLAADANTLPLLLVRRKLDPLTQAEFRAVALQAIMCAYEYTDLRWLRSYWARDDNELHCLFRARTHDLVREHAARSRIPCDEVLDAVDLLQPG
jgi:hypothetical protein